MLERLKCLLKKHEWLRKTEPWAVVDLDLPVKLIVYKCPFCKKRFRGFYGSEACLAGGEEKITW